MTAKQLLYGTVLWFGKGYGFIKTDDGSSDKFVHYSNIVTEPGKFKTLTAGQRVSFVIGMNKNGPQAEQVIVIEEYQEEEEE